MSRELKENLMGLKERQALDNANNIRDPFYQKQSNPKGNAWVERFVVTHCLHREHGKRITLGCWEIKGALNTR